MRQAQWKALLVVGASGVVLTATLVARNARATTNTREVEAFQHERGDDGERRRDRRDDGDRREDRRIRDDDDRASRLASWVELGANGQAIARVITAETACPFIQVDDDWFQMSLRVKAETIPQRPTTSTPDNSKPSAFPVTTCEYDLPERARLARVMGAALPLPKRHPRRIVILGDTGCRLQIGNPWQACYDPQQWPLQRIADTAAKFEPDLVLHVGDYHYRENPCPPDIGGCQGSPWGYGWDVWQADLFKPAAKLLAAAPWIVVRGNHEECARGGQGWFRFLDPRAYESLRSCNDPANDTAANYSDPYAVPIGDRTRIIVFDSSKAPAAPLASSNPAFAKYHYELMEAATLAADNPEGLNIWANHHPLLAFSPVAGMTPNGGNAGLLSVMYATYGTDYFPPGIGLALHGHTHIFEALNFSSHHPATIMNGNGGDNLDINLPDPFPPDAHPDGAFASAVNVQEVADTSAFGFMVGDREAGGKWTFREYTRDGRLLTSCRFAGSKMSCSKVGFLH
jgi:hypothetical protein